MSKEAIKEKLLEIAKEQLSEANVTVIKELIQDNADLKELNIGKEATIKSLKADKIHIQNLLDSANGTISSNEKRTKDILLRESKLKANEIEYETKNLKVDMIILQGKFDAKEQSLKDIMMLNETLFKNKNIHHMISTVGSMPVTTNLDQYGNQQYPMQAPFDSTTTKHEIED